MNVNRPIFDKLVHSHRSVKYRFIHNAQYSQKLRCQGCILQSEQEGFLQLGLLEETSVLKKMDYIRWLLNRSNHRDFRLNNRVGCPSLPFLLSFSFDRGLDDRDLQARSFLALRSRFRTWLNLCLCLKNRFALSYLFLLLMRWHCRWCRVKFAGCCLGSFL